MPILGRQGTLQFETVSTQVNRSLEGDSARGRRGAGESVQSVSTTWPSTYNLSRAMCINGRDRPYILRCKEAIPNAVSMKPG